MPEIPTFPAKLGLFYAELQFFWRLRFVCSWACFIWKLLVFSACFLQISVFWFVFFSDFMALLVFQFTTKRNLGMFLYEFAPFGLAFADLLPCIVYNLPAGFLFCSVILPKVFWACFSVKLSILGLIFRVSCLHLQNNLAPLNHACWWRLASSVAAGWLGLVCWGKNVANSHLSPGPFNSTVGYWTTPASLVLSRPT